MGEQDYQEIGRTVVEAKEARRSLALRQSTLLSLAERLGEASKLVHAVLAGKDYRQNFPAFTNVPTQDQLIGACEDYDQAKKRDSALRTLASNLGIPSDEPTFRGFGVPPGI